MKTKRLTLKLLIVLCVTIITFPIVGQTTRIWTGGNGTGTEIGAATKLQAQTNSLSGNWDNYPGGSASPVTVPIDATKGTAFFRLTTILR